MAFVALLLARAREFSKPASPDSPPSLNRQLFSLAWPSLVENLLQTMLGVVDLIFVGQLGADAIAGIGLGNQLMYLLLVVFMGLAVGNTALVARAVGAKDHADAAHIAKQSLIIAILAAIPIALIGFFWSDNIIALMGATRQVTQLGGAFLRITSVFAVFISIMLIGGGTLRGAGDTRTPMLITGVINVINILLDYLLIFGNFGFPNLGAIGSAYATTIARGIGALFMLYALFARKSVLKLDWRGGWNLTRATLERILNIGGPSAGENFVFQFGFTLFSAVVISLGTDDLAAQNVAFNISSLSVLPAFAFGVAALTLVGQNLGAKNPERATEVAKQALKSGMIWMCVMGAAFILWRRALVAVYTQDARVIELGAGLMIFIALAQPLQAIAIVLGQSLRGAGDTRATLAITFIGIWVIRLGVGYLIGIALGFGLFGVWIGWIADFSTRALLVWLRYHTGRWKTLRV